MNQPSSLRIARPDQGPTVPASVLRRSDAELLEAWHLDQEHAALAALVEKYAGLVLNVCRRQCRSGHDIEDAFQATFLQLACTAGRIRNPEALGGWLHRTAYRIACRARDRQRSGPDTLVEDPPDPEHPLEQVARRHELRVLDEELAALPDRYRAALALHFLEGRTHAQIASQLGTSTGVVRGRLHRAKAQLRRRLRRRGVIPGAVTTALALWPADPATASQLTGRFLQQVPQSGGIPDTSSPNAPEPFSSSLQPLLQQGKPTMSLTSTVVGGVAAATLGLLAVASQLSGTPANDQAAAASAPQQTNGNVHLQQAPQPDVLAQLGGAAAPRSNPPASSATEAANSGGGVAGGYGMGMRGGAGAASRLPASQASEPEPEPTPPSPTAQRILDRMDEPIEISGGEVPVSQLESLGEQLNMPVLVDQRGIEAAEAEGKTVKLSSSGVPLRTALRKMLQPLALKAVVEDEGLVITVNTAELARRGIGASQWISIDNQMAEEIDKKLDETASDIEFFEETLEQAAIFLSENLGVPVLIDRRALEAIGLSSDVPVTLALTGVSWRTVLEQLLEDLDLTYTNRGEFLEITTKEAAESRLLSRIYWLDATGVYSDFDAPMQAIESTIQPDTWEAIGGPSSMVPIALENRGALLVSTTTDVHHEIEKLLELMRQNYFGEAGGFHSKPATKLPQRDSPAGMSGGMGGMGGGGMGGGFH